MIADEVALGVTYDEIDDYLEGKEIPVDAQQKSSNGGIKHSINVICQFLIFDDFLEINKVNKRIK